MESSRACWTGEGEIEFYLLLDPVTKSAAYSNIAGRKTKIKLCILHAYGRKTFLLNNEMNMNGWVSQKHLTFEQKVHELFCLNHPC
jgi:hypothetical protein